MLAHFWFRDIKQRIEAPAASKGYMKTRNYDGPFNS